MAKRVAVVDDEQDFLTLMQMLLTEQGYEVGLCAEGTEAFRFVKSWKPDLVFLDIRMTGVSGLEILHQMKADADTQNIKVIITSAATDELSLLGPELRMRGCEILVKPFDIDEAIRKTRECIGPPL